MTSKSSVYNHSKMSAPWKVTKTPDSLVIQINSFYDSAASQKTRAAEEAARNPSPVALLRISHHDDRVAMANRHDREQQELLAQHARQRSAAVAKHMSTRHEMPGRKVVLGLPGPDEKPERDRLLARQAAEREKQAAAHGRSMEAVLRKYGHAK